jgi:hypothetical protein
MQVRAMASMPGPDFLLSMILLPSSFICICNYRKSQVASSANPGEGAGEERHRSLAIINVAEA